MPPKLDGSGRAGCVATVGCMTNNKPNGDAGWDARETTPAFFRGGSGVVDHATRRDSGVTVRSTMRLSGELQHRRGQTIDARRRVTEPQKRPQAGVT